MPRQLEDWLKAYGEYTAESESPQVFHYWVGIGTIAGAAQRKILMQTKYFDIHSNMYIILVSPPGVGKKTTALRIGKSFLQGVEPKVNFATESTSAGALIKAMASITNPAHQSMTLFSSELGTLLALDPVGMVDFLTDIYDGNPNWEKQTIARDKESITHPWLNLMAGTTPQWLGDNASATFVEGGFAARSIYPYSDELILESPFPEETPEQAALRRTMVEDLSHIATLEGTFRFDGGKTGAAYRYYDTWYRDKTRMPRVMDPRLAGYYTRKHIHVLKVAMALSLSYKDDLVITLEDLKRAQVLLENTEPGMRRAFSAVGKNEHATDFERVREQIRDKPGISYSELLIANYHNLKKPDLDRILEELQYTGMRVENSNGKRAFTFAPKP